MMRPVSSIDAWLRSAIADAERRGLPELKPLLEALANSTAALRGMISTSAPTRDRPVVERPGLTHVRMADPETTDPRIDPSMTDPLMTIAEFSRRWRAHEITAEQVTEDCLRRIDADNPRLNAFVLVMRDEARRQAREADRELAAGRDRGPLHGVPLSVKDLIDIQGVPTTAASRVREGHVADRDAPIIAHLRQAGAVFIGKTNLHEFAFGTTNEDSAFGPARNPYDATRSPGGSSGGSAASVAAGMALATIGTDTGGSVRIPAAACGLVGLKPADGDVSTEGVVPLSRTLDHVGPLATTVADAATVYHALLGDPTAGPVEPVPVSSLRLGLLRSYFCDLLDDEVRARFEEALDRLRSAGARIEDVEIPHAKDLVPIYQHITFADAAAYHAATLEAMPERYSAPVRLRLELGRFVLGEDYVRALEGREVLRKEVDAALAGHDALVLPTLPIPAPPIGAVSMRVRSMDGHSLEEPVRSLTLRLTQLFNVTGHPAIAIPCGTTAAGLPCSLQLAGPRAGTNALLRVALGGETTIAGL
jgi:aspartyl-tRNA(Asn)/glutamyl-tRNA(Gln) amidotransferase subunit A